MHYGMGKISRCQDVLPSESDRCSDINTTSFLRKMIQTEMPDLVVFTGDNIYGPSTTDAAESLFSAFAPVIKLKIPWAAILGNHDQESTMNREELMSLMSLMDYSISQVNPYAEVPRKLVEIDGFGNYNIKVHGPFGSDMVNTSIFNLYLLDSGDRATVDGRRTYGWIKKSQLLWLSETAKQLQGTYASPALAFFHIPIQEVRGLWYKNITGQFQEAIACSFVNTGVLDSFVAMRDVKAVFMGHDHLNDFCGDIDGIWFCFGGGFGYHGYGRAGWPRRVRVISAELGEDQKTQTRVRKIKTWKRLDDDFFTKIDEQVLLED